MEGLDYSSIQDSITELQSSEALNNTKALLLRQLVDLKDPRITQLISLPPTGISEALLLLVKEKHKPNYVIIPPKVPCNELTSPLDEYLFARKRSQAHDNKAGELSIGHPSLVHIEELDSPDNQTN